MLRLLKLAGVNLAVLAVCVAAAELLFGGWFKSGFGALNIPRGAVTFDVSDLYPGGGQIRYVRDEYGLRGQYPRPGCIDILTVGGSTTDQRALGEGETWQDRLRQHFAQAGRTVWIANAGIDGQSTIGHLYDFERWFPLIPGLKPRYVLVYAGINDVFTYMSDTTDRLLAGHWLLRLHHAVKNNSALYRLFDTVRGTLAARRARLTGEVVDYERARWTGTPNQGGHAERFAEGAARYGQRLARLVEVIRRGGAEAILVTQRRGDARVVDGRLQGLEATPPAMNGLDQAIVLDIFNREAMRVCREAGAICVDLAQRLEFRPGDHYDLLHTTPSGAARIAAGLFEALEALPVDAAGDCR